LFVPPVEAPDHRPILGPTSTTDIIQYNRQQRHKIAQNESTHGEITNTSDVIVQWALTNPHSPQQLSKEDEEATGDEIEVRREDQDKINKFSRLHQRELSIEDELKDKNVSSFHPSP